MLMVASGMAVKADGTFYKGPCIAPDLSDGDRSALLAAGVVIEVPDPAPAVAASAPPPPPPKRRASPKSRGKAKGLAKAEGK